MFTIKLQTTHLDDPNLKASSRVISCDSYLINEYEEYYEVTAINPMEHTIMKVIHNEYIKNTMYIENMNGQTVDIVRSKTKRIINNKIVFSEMR